MQNILNFDTNILNLGRVKLRSKFNFGESSRGRQFAIEKVSVTIWWKSNKNGQQPKIKRKQILFFSAKSKIIKIRLYQNLFFEPNSTLQNLITTAVLLAPNLIQPQQLMHAFLTLQIRTGTEFGKILTWYLIWYSLYWFYNRFIWNFGHFYAFKMGSSPIRGFKYSVW